MTKARRIRSATWPLRILSAVTLVALIVAPSCAPLCAGKSCPQAEGSAVADGSCHRAGAMHHETLARHGVRNCDLPALTAVISTSAAFRGDSSASQLSVTGGKFLVAKLQNC